MERKRRSLSCLEEFNQFHVNAGRQLQRHLLRTNPIGRSYPAMLSVGIGVIEQVNRIARSRLPTEHFNQPCSLYQDNALVMAYPADRILQQLKKVAVSGEPIGALDIPWKPGHTACSGIAQNYRRLLSVRMSRIGKLWRIPHKARHHGERGVVDSLERHAILCPGYPVCVVKTFRDGVWLTSLRCFDAG